MKTTHLIEELKAIEPNLTTSQSLALVEYVKSLNYGTSDALAEIANSGRIVALAEIQKDVFHRAFMSQKPLHETDCLVCGAMVVGA